MFPQQESELLRNFFHTFRSRSKRLMSSKPYNWEKITGNFVDLESTPTKSVHRIRQFISTHSIACVCDNDRCLIAQWTDRSPESSLKSQEWILHVGRDENFAEETRILEPWLGMVFSSFWRTWRWASQPWLVHTPFSPAKPWKIGISLSQSTTIGSTSDAPKNTCNYCLVASDQLQACLSKFLIRKVILRVYFMLQQSWLHQSYFSSG